MKALLLLCCASVAPAAGAVQWSLDSCISYAHEHNINVRMSSVECLNAEYGVTEAKDRFLPSVGAGASYNFAFGRGLTADNTYANRNTQNFGVNVGLNMPIFQGLAGVRRLEYAKAALRTMLEQHEATKDDVTLNVMAQYLQVLYCGEMLDVAKDQAALSRTELARRRELLAAGKIPELDVLEAEAQVARDELTQVNAENDRALALVAMCRLLQLDDMEGFDVAPVDMEVPPLPDVDYVYASALRCNHGVQAAALNVKAAEGNVSLARTGYMPTLSFSAGLGSNYYTVSGIPGDTFGHQLRDNFSKSLGFSLSIPIFDAFGTRNAVRRAKASQISAELRLDDARMQLYQNIRQSHSQAVAALRKVESGAVAERASKAALDAVTEKYSYGRANATEFEQAKSAWFRSRAELVQARYESILRSRVVEFYRTGR
ncbi:MAG: TolC family protein [Muribaculaceae bacterium]|nr:TolC family protein [Muribaculaceae bacterium]